MALLSVDEAVLRRLLRGEGLGQGATDGVIQALRAPGSSPVMETRSAVRPGGAQATFAPHTLTVRPPAVSAGETVSAPGARDRYEDLGLLGVGGMGEVRRVRDRQLGRVVAMKIIKPGMGAHPSLVARFREEVLATAQLQHPSIIPVYDMGHLPDGRQWFTMREIAGKTLGSVIAEAHGAEGRGPGSAAHALRLRRLLTAFQRVCVAVAYAHSRGVVHRDLKPANIMVGDHGEVLVVDWGLAKVLGRPGGEPTADAPPPVQIHRLDSGWVGTQMGSVSGTPAYMPPEQARGEIHQIDERSDVYALGAILYQVLSGRPPYHGPDAEAVLQQVRAGPPPPLTVVDAPGEATTARGAPRLMAAGRGADGWPPGALVGICGQAMARDPAARFATAVALGGEIAAWLDGIKRADEARAVVEQALTKGPEAAALRSSAAALRAEAREALTGIAPWQPESDKVAAWALEDEAAVQERRAEMVALEEEALLRASLTHDPALAEAHAALAERYRAVHASAESDRRDARRSELLLREHLAALPTGHPDRAGHAAYLRGRGALSLVTDPPGAEVLLHRYVPVHRRLVPRFECSLGTTPLRAVPLEQGSYLCVLRHPDRVEVRYPVHIARQEHWDGRRPGDDAPHPVVLPTPGELGPEDCLVPAGWFWSGDSSPPTPLSPPKSPWRRVWVDGLVVRRTPVTNQAYLRFLDDLVARGREEEALRCVPRERAGTVGELGALIYGFDGQRFSLRPDADGDVWSPAWPVVMVDGVSAMAFAAWEAARTGQPWRLPGELEWEKAGRGVDGRAYAWGDHFDSSWACTKRSHRGEGLPSVVGAWPVDVSTYGLVDMTGNAMDWCLPSVVVGSVVAPWSGQGGAALGGGPATMHPRGGAWDLSQELAFLGATRRYSPSIIGSGLSFRLARALG